MIRKIFLVILFLCLTSCLAAGGPYTLDPYKKLSYALQMDSFRRCIPATNFAKDALDDLKKKNDNFGIQYSYVVLSINSEVFCKFFNDKFGEQELKYLSEKYFIKAMEINDVPQQNIAFAIESLFQYLQKNQNLSAIEVYHKYKIIQFYHTFLAIKYKNEDSLRKVFVIKKMIDDINTRYPEAMVNRKYIFDYSTKYEDRVMLKQKTQNVSKSKTSGNLE
jgi:hypothetical protein